MDACELVSIMDTANYEPKDVAKFEYKWHWAYQDRYKDAGLMALMGSDSTGYQHILCLCSKSITSMKFTMLISSIVRG